MIEVKEVKNDGQLKDFIAFAWQVYKDSPAWVPPLVQSSHNWLSGKSLFFNHCRHKLFLVFKQGQVVARAAVFADRDYIAYSQKKIGFLGYFEALEDQFPAVEALFNRAESYLLSQGISAVLAPFNGNMSREIGLLTKGYDTYPLFLMPYNPAYYRDYFLKNNYREDKKLIAYKVDLSQEKIAWQIKHLLQKQDKSGLNIRPLDLKNFKQDVFNLAEIYNQTFSGHWGYVPQAKEEFYESFQLFRWALEKDFILFAEIKNEIAGFVLCVPDYNSIIKRLDGKLTKLNVFDFFRLKKKIEKGRLIAVGVSQKYRGRKVAPYLIAQAFEAMIKKKYRFVEYSWVLCENISSQNTAAKFYGTPYKQYTVYLKPIGRQS